MFASQVDAGLSAYAGDAFHRPPLMLAAYRALTGWAGRSGSFLLAASTPRAVLAALAVLCDVATALALRSLARRYLATEECPEREAGLVGAGEAAEAAQAALDPEEKRRRRLATKGAGGYLDFRNSISVERGPLCAARLPDTVAAVYLLHPFTVMTCGALSSAALSHAIVAATLLFAANGNMPLAGMALGLATFVCASPPP